MRLSSRQDNRGRLARPEDLVPDRGRVFLPVNAIKAVLRQDPPHFAR